MTEKYGVMSLTTDIVRVETRAIISLRQRNAVEGGIRMTEICATSPATEMHAIRLTTGVGSVSASSKNDMMRGTMTIIVPSTTNLTNSAPLKEGVT
jgi:hypothetical protein